MSIHLGAGTDTKLAVTDSGRSLTPEITSPQGSIAPLLAAPGFVPPRAVPPALGMVEDRAVIPLRAISMALRKLWRR